MHGAKIRTKIRTAKRFEEKMNKNRVIRMIRRKTSVSCLLITVYSECLYGTKKAPCSRREGTGR